jgi:hypothetical protein
MNGFCPAQVCVDTGDHYAGIHGQKLDADK